MYQSSNSEPDSRSISVPDLCSITRINDKIFLQVYQRLDESEVAHAYWKNILIVSEENLKSLDGNRDRNRSRGIKKSVKDDVLKMFTGKSVSMLDKMSTGRGL